MAGVVKKTHSFDPEVYEHFAAIAEALGITESRALGEAAERWVKIHDGLAAVAEWEAENGPISAEEEAAADAILDAHGIGL